MTSLLGMKAHSRWLMLAPIPLLAFATACSSGGNSTSSSTPTSTATATVSSALGTAGSISQESRLAAAITASPAVTVSVQPAATSAAAPVATVGAGPVLNSEVLGITAAAEATSTPIPPAPTVASAATATQVPASTATTVPPTAVPPTATAVIASVAPSSDLAAQAMALVNDYRAANGLSKLRGSAALHGSAGRYAKLMGDSGKFGHYEVDGSTPQSRFAGSGFNGRLCGEALAAGQSTAAEAVTTWKNSPEHNAILLSSEPGDIGIGYYFAASGAVIKHYWVLVTGCAS